MKKITIISILLFTVTTISLSGQGLTTLNIKDWNSLKKSGFYECLTPETKNAPGNQLWYWGINVAHTYNSQTTDTYQYNGQLLFGVSSGGTEVPHIYARSTGKNGTGAWAKVVHSKGNHAIDGKLTVKEVEVKVVTGADFVFDSDYRLPTLSEVAAHIREHKHLPEIPSATQMQEEGVNLSELQIKLLQKIEELTLYMIEQQKTISRQQEQINALQQVVKTQ